jgi:hypothetical protein
VLRALAACSAGAHLPESGFAFAGVELTVDQPAEINVDHEDDRVKWLQNLAGVETVIRVGQLRDTT